VCPVRAIFSLDVLMPTPILPSHYAHLAGLNSPSFLKMRESMSASRSPLASLPLNTSQ